jgi:hypothetical protein
MPGRRRTDRVLDGGGAPQQIGPHLRGTHAQLQTVSMTVKGDEVPLVGDPGDQFGTPRHLLSDHEEHRLRASAREQLEHRRGALRMRAIVKGQTDSGAGPGEGSERPGYPQSMRGTREHGSERMSDHGGMIADSPG